MFRKNDLIQIKFIKKISRRYVHAFEQFFTLSCIPQISAKLRTKNSILKISFTSFPFTRIEHCPCTKKAKMDIFKAQETKLICRYKIHVLADFPEILRKTEIEEVNHCGCMPNTQHDQSYTKTFCSIPCNSSFKALIKSILKRCPKSNNLSVLIT